MMNKKIMPDPPAKNRIMDTKHILRFMMCAYIAPEMLIEGRVQPGPGSLTGEAYKRMESAVLSHPNFYLKLTNSLPLSDSFVEETVKFYNSLTSSDAEFYDLAWIALYLKAHSSYFLIR